MLTKHNLIGIKEANYLLESWEKNALIKNDELASYSIEDIQDIYPINRQPICYHPYILRNGTQEKTQYILIQSAYKFMSDIAFIETKAVNNLILKVVNKQIAYEFEQTAIDVLLTVSIDENYHALMCRKFIKALEEKTGIIPINNEHDGGLITAINEMKQNLEPTYSDAFEIVAICIAENSITKELISITEQNARGGFHTINKHHMLDEMRHSAIFKRLLIAFWSQLPTDVKDSIAKKLPAFIEKYLSPEFPATYDKEILSNLNYSNEEIEEIIFDSYPPLAAGKLHKTNPVMKNILAFLHDCKVLEYSSVNEIFVNLGWLDSV